MYCPNCGQQQISDEMRFCSRCGLALSGLAEWLARGGVPAKPEEKSPVAPGFTPPQEYAPRSQVDVLQRRPLSYFSSHQHCRGQGRATNFSVRPIFRVARMDALCATLQRQTRTSDFSGGCCTDIGLRIELVAQLITSGQ